jgi:ABC-2 type transport system permease protein
MNGMLLVAKNEFSLTMKNPVVLVSVMLLVIISVVSAYGFTANPGYNIGQDLGLLSFFMGCISGNIVGITSTFIILAVCVGVFSIAEERHGSTLNVLMSKPLYRRDVILGKVIGLGGFLLMVISFIMAILVSSDLILNPLPTGLLIEMFARTVTIVVSLFLFSMIMLGISMMIGILFKNIALVFTLTATVVYLQWYTGILGLLGPLTIFEPLSLSIFYAWGNSNTGDVSNFIFITSAPFIPWISSVYPYFILLTFEALLVILIDCILFNRDSIGE